MPKIQLCFEDDLGDISERGSGERGEQTSQASSQQSRSESDQEESQESSQKKNERENPKKRSLSSESKKQRETREKKRKQLDKWFSKKTIAECIEKVGDSIRCKTCDVMLSCYRANTSQQHEPQAKNQY